MRKPTLSALLTIALLAVIALPTAAADFDNRVGIVERVIDTIARWAEKIGIVVEPNGAKGEFIYEPEGAAEPSGPTIDDRVDLPLQGLGASVTPGG